MGAPFTARYTSRCKRCGCLIAKFDEAGYDDYNQVCCKSCWDIWGDNSDSEWEEN